MFWKKFTTIFCAIFIIVVVVYTKYLITKGFLPRKIEYLASYKIDYESPISIPENISYIFDNEFTYLGKGGQTYVFESADKNYVIKFIRYHKYKTPFWAEILNYFNLLSGEMDVTLKAKENRYNLVMKSYMLSYHFLSDFTNVEYIHLNQTDFINKKVVLRVPFFHKHVVDMDKVAFIIQKKADLFSDVMKKHIESDDVHEVETIIDSFFDCLVYLSKNNLVNRDFPNMVRNSGCIDNKYLMIDVGSFFNVPNNDKEYLKKQFFNFSHVLEAYLEENGEKYLPYFKNRFQNEEVCLFQEM